MPFLHAYVWVVSHYPLRLSGLLIIHYLLGFYLYKILNFDAVVRNLFSAQFRDILLLRTGLREFSEPPSSASLLALSRAIKASRPNLTKDVFSLTPVSLDAFLIMSSSMFNVVLICINMHHMCIYVNDILSGF